jgi:hypothetical protein
MSWQNFPITQEQISRIRYHTQRLITTNSGGEYDAMHNENVVRCAGKDCFTIWGWED